MNTDVRILQHLPERRDATLGRACRLALVTGASHRGRAFVLRCIRLDPWCHMWHHPPVAKDIASILAEMRSNPAGVRYADACKVVTHYFGEPRQSGTSHKVWKMPWPGDPRVNMQAGESGKAKPYQVRQALAAIGMLLDQRGATPIEEAPTAAKKRPKKTRKRGRR